MNHYQLIYMAWTCRYCMYLHIVSIKNYVLHWFERGVEQLFMLELHELSQSSLHHKHMGPVFIVYCCLDTSGVLGSYFISSFNSLICVHVSGHQC